MTDAATITNAEASTSLTVTQRAALALGITDERLATLRATAANSAGIVRITNKDGYSECHAARMALKNLRLDIEKAGEKAREDAQAYAKAIIAGQKQLLGVIEPEEQRLKAIQDAEDERVAAEKRRAIVAEQARIAGIQQRIEWIRSRALDMVGHPLDEIVGEIVALEGLPVTDELYGEFVEQARAALGIVLDKLYAMRDGAAKADADARAIAEQRAELDRKQAALDAADRERAARIMREDSERKAQQKAVDDARAAAQKIEDDARAAKFAEIEAAQRFASDWDDAYREDAYRKEEAAAAKLARTAREAEKAAAEQRRQERVALEAIAKPRRALDLIVFEAREAAAGHLRRIVEIATECTEAMDALAELDKAPS